MKMAKKVFAVVLAVAMIAALSAMAFAAPAGAKFTYSVGEVKDGKVEVAVAFVDCVGLASGDIIFTHDDNVTAVARKTGADVKNIGDIDNSFSNEFNAALTATEAKLGFYFKDMLWDSATWAADENADAEVNGENFKAFTVTFTLADAAKATTVKAAANVKFKDGTEIKLNDDIVLVAAAETTTAAPETTTAAPETTTAAPETTTAAPETTTAAPETTTAADGETTTVAPETTTVKGEADKPMGDNGVLAIVAGVCALAGAAFVVTKKRK